MEIIYSVLPSWIFFSSFFSLFFFPFHAHQNLTTGIHRSQRFLTHLLCYLPKALLRMHYNCTLPLSPPPSVSWHGPCKQGTRSVHEQHLQIQASGVQQPSGASPTLCPSSEMGPNNSCTRGLALAIGAETDRAAEAGGASVRTNHGQIIWEVAHGKMG